MSSSLFLRMAEAHWGGSLHDGQGKSHGRVVLHGVAPVVAGCFALIPGGTWTHELDLVSGVAIITGLLFSLLVFLIQLRHQVRLGDAQAAEAQRDKSNLDYAFYSSAYAVAVGFWVICLSLAQDASATVLMMVSPYGRIASNWIIFSVFVHFLMTMWTCVGRLWRLYEVFGLNRS